MMIIDVYTHTHTLVSVAIPPGRCARQKPQPVCGFPTSYVYVIFQCAYPFQSLSTIYKKQSLSTLRVRFQWAKFVIMSVFGFFKSMADIHRIR